MIIPAITKNNLPKVSVILPTFNRLSFLDSAMDSIASQTLLDWELVIVDDGSTDGTEAFLRNRLASFKQPWRYIFQKNQGAYQARNRGLEAALGKYVAFFDSDDKWLPHHLNQCVSALECNDDVDWVFGACRIVDYKSSKVLHENSFYTEDTPLSFLSLPTRKRGDLYVLDANGLLENVLGGFGLGGGLQNSVIRRKFFEKHRFNTSFYNEAEDQAIVPRAIKAGLGFAYFNSVHVEYRVHDSNSSGSSTVMNFAKKERIIIGLIEGFENLPQQIDIGGPGMRRLKARLAELYMWQLGYSTYAVYGRIGLARKAYMKAIKLNPTKLQYWKTLLCSYIKPQSMN